MSYTIMSLMENSGDLPIFPRTFVYGAAASADQIEGG
jgi:hypothetical protein